MCVLIFDVADGWTDLEVELGIQPASGMIRIRIQWFRICLTYTWWYRMGVKLCRQNSIILILIKIDFLLCLEVGSLSSEVFYHCRLDLL